MMAVLGAALAVLTVSLLLPPRVTLAPGRAWSSAVDGGGPVPSPDPDQDVLGRHRGAVAVLAAALPVLLLANLVGVIAGVVTSAVVWRVLGARESLRDRRRREQLTRSLPHALDLLAVTLASGASPARALAVLARAVEGPLADELRLVERSLDLGRDPVRVWRDVSARPGLAPLGRSMVRAIDTGASVSETLQRLAEDLHAGARLEREGRARAVGVKAALPLGLCLLPAFVLVGVVPLVGSSAATLLAP